MTEREGGWRRCHSPESKTLDQSIGKTNAWLAEIAAEFGTEDRQFAYRVTRAWLLALRDRLPVPVAANFAAQLPEVARLVTKAVRRHVSGGALDGALDVLPPDLSQLIEPASTGEPAADRRGRAWQGVTE